MADKSYNVSVGYKNISNIYNDLGSSLTGLKTVNGNSTFYLFKSSPINKIGYVFDPNQFPAFSYESITIFYQGTTGGNSSGIMMDNNTWIKDDFSTNVDNYPIPENSLIYPQIGNPSTIKVGDGVIIKDHHCYYLNEIEASGLYFEKGKTYQFVQTGISNSGNPLNIYVDEYGNKKLEKYVSISGTAGVDRYVTVSIPKSYKETNTLYYGNESGDFFGAPIKLISTDYYLKHNIKLLCFGAVHDGVKYYLPDSILDQKFLFTQSSLNYTLLKSGIYPIVSNHENNQYSTSTLYRRKDTLDINLVKSTGYNGTIMDRDFVINYFGNKLKYTRNPIEAYDWPDLGWLYFLLEYFTFGCSGQLDAFEIDPKKYYQYGYQLSGCEQCIEKIVLTTGEGNIYSGKIDIYYNPLKLINNSFSNQFLNVTSGDIRTEDFISFDNVPNVKYTKTFYQDTTYSIPRKI